MPDEPLSLSVLLKAQEERDELRVKNNELRWAVIKTQGERDELRASLDIALESAEGYVIQRARAARASLDINDVAETQQWQTAFERSLLDIDALRAENERLWAALREHHPLEAEWLFCYICDKLATPDVAPKPTQDDPS